LDLTHHCGDLVSSSNTNNREDVSAGKRPFGFQRKFVCYVTIVIYPKILLADARLPDALAQKLGTRPQNAPHFSPAFFILAAVALCVVAYLMWDVLRQKREERRQRQRLERFREKKLKEAQGPPA
jgi:lysylphosphatidylglycerol synthetase-like protein (DUF2156 family)